MSLCGKLGGMFCKIYCFLGNSAVEMSFDKGSEFLIFTGSFRKAIVATKRFLTFLWWKCILLKPLLLVHGRQFTRLTSRWWASFRFPKFLLTEPCLLTRDLWKCFEVGLPNLSSSTPPPSFSPPPPLWAPLPSLPSPPSPPSPPSFSIQGAEPPRWQF